mgnify:CR=1 FL=1
METIIKILAAKYGLDEEVIEKIIRSQFNFVASTMQEGNFESVHLHHFGKFAVKPNSIKRVNDLKEFKNKHAKQTSNNIW